MRALHAVLIAPALLIGFLKPAQASAVSDLQPTSAPAAVAKALQGWAGICDRRIRGKHYAKDLGGKREIEICSSARALHWTSDLDIHCDGQKTKECNWNTDPWYRPETACHQSDGKPMNSAKTPFIVLPMQRKTWAPALADTGCGTVVAVIHGSRIAYGVVGDMGPSSAIGEGSHAMARQLGLDPDPIAGGVESADVSYLVFPGVKVRRIEDASQARDLGKRVVDAFLMNRIGTLCTIARYVRSPCRQPKPRDPDHLSGELAGRKPLRVRRTGRQLDGTRVARSRSLPGSTA